MAHYEFQIGDSVSFDYDGLCATGIIIKIHPRTVILLDEKYSIGRGWIIQDYHDVDRKYYGRKGWNVPMNYLKLISPKKTKLGNSL